jgi:hypothetical protein
VERLSRFVLRWPSREKKEPKITKFAVEIAEAILPAINAMKTRTRDPQDPHGGPYAAMNPPDEQHDGPWMYVERGAAVVELVLIPIADSAVDA